MSFIKNVLCIILILASEGLSLAASTSAPTSTRVSPLDKSAADALWKWVDDTSNFPDFDGHDNTVEQTIQVCLARKQCRERGLAAWDHFPSDPRQWQWLKQIGLGDVWDFWKDPAQGARALKAYTPQWIEPDREARADWNRRYLAMRAEYLASPQVSQEDKDRLRRSEMEERIREVTNAIKRGEKPNLGVLERDFWDFAEVHPDIEIALRATDLSEAVYASDPSAETYWISAMKLSRSDSLRYVGRGQEELARLRTSPMELQFSGMDGTPVDLAKLRGKVVLVDVWSTTCGDCIASMPLEKTIYDRYRSQGFEMVGVCLMSSGAIEAVERRRLPQILASKKPDWPQWIATGQEAVDFKTRYGIWGVPRTWLLDRSGRLVSTDIGIHAINLETLVRHYLSLPPLSSTAEVAAGPKTN